MIIHHSACCRNLRSKNTAAWIIRSPKNRTHCSISLLSKLSAYLLRSLLYCLITIESSCRFFSLSCVHTCPTSSLYTLWRLCLDIHVYLCCWLPYDFIHILFVSVYLLSMTFLSLYLYLALLSIVLFIWQNIQNLFKDTHSLVSIIKIILRVMITIIITVIKRNSLIKR